MSSKEINKNRQILYRLKKFYVMPIIFGVLLLIFWKVLTATQTVSPDAYLILPHLESFSSISEYLKSLVNLSSIDIQPVRDLSLWIDWWFFHKTGLNSFIWTNVLLFLMTIFVWIKIQASELANKGVQSVLFGVLLACYPVYAHIVSYSMGRKHLLSFFFISLSTYFIIKVSKKRFITFKEVFWIALTFFLSVFSQPISLLFPLWALLYLKLEKIKLEKSFISLFILLLIIFIFGFSVNYFYYENSLVIKNVFGSKTDNALNISDRIYSLFIYFYNALYPFELSFYSSAQIKRPFFGLMLFTLFSLVYLGITKNIKHYLQWMCYALLPLLIITTSPYNIYYTYLTIPLAAILLLQFELMNKLLTKLPFWFGKNSLAVLLLLLAIFSHFEANKWTDERKWGEMNISRDPHCNSVIRYSRDLLSKGELPSQDIMNFMAQNNCNHYSTDYHQIELIVFQSQIIFYNEAIPIEQRVTTLKNHGKINFYPLLVLASIYIKESKISEAKEMIEETIRFLGDVSLGTMYDKIFDDYLIPFCEQNEQQECVKRFKRLTLKKNTPYL